MSGRHMIIGMHLGNGYGLQPGAWRMPGVDLRSHASFEAKVRQAQAAERDKMAGIDEEDANSNLDVMPALAAAARETSRIGLMGSGAATCNEPCNLARPIKALDIKSHGRAGWNTITSSGEDVAANCGQRLPSSADRHGRANASSPCGARFIFRRSSRGSRSSSMPVAAPTPMLWRGAMPAWSSVPALPSKMRVFRDAAEHAARDSDEIKYVPGLMTTIARGRRTALDRRIALTGRMFPQRAACLGQMPGLRLDPGRLDELIPADQLAMVRPSPRDPRSSRAPGVAHEGWSSRDVLAHGVIAYHPVIAGPAGPAVEAAKRDRMMEVPAASGPSPTHARIVASNRITNAPGMEA